MMSRNVRESVKALTDGRASIVDYPLRRVFDYAGVAHPSGFEGWGILFSEESQTKLIRSALAKLPALSVHLYLSPFERGDNGQEVLMGRAPCAGTIQSPTTVLGRGMLTEPATRA